MSTTTAAPSEISPSALLAQAFDAMRVNGASFLGSNKQLALLLVDALGYLTQSEIPDPDCGAQAKDQEELARQLHMIAESFEGDGSYAELVVSEEG